MISYPLDEKYLSRNKKKIKRMLLDQIDASLTIKIAILGGSTTTEIKDQLEICLLDRGMRVEFYESDYNMYYQEAVFGEALRRFKPDIIYIHTTLKNLCYLPDIAMGKEEVEDGMYQEIMRFRQIWDALLTDTEAIIIQNNVELPKYRPLGNLDQGIYYGTTHYIHNLNTMMNDYAEKHKRLIINDINYLAARVGLDVWHDMKVWYAYKYAMSFKGITELAYQLSHIIGAIYNTNKKILMLDLDHTLWGGVIGDDGVDGIRIGEDTPSGQSYTDLQYYVKALKTKGIGLGICSKNELAYAMEGLEHPDMVLKKDDFVAMRINWEPKYMNISEMVKELNVGIDSVVFLDDNAMERESVRIQLPSVAVPDIGDDSVHYIEYLDRNGYFELLNISKEDKERSQYYLQNNQRQQEEKTFEDYEAFLHSLTMQAEIGSFQSIYLDRITQLINKTNQFNLTTKRYTLQEINTIYDDSNYLTVYGKLTDKFGDNGLVSAIIGHKENQVVHIDLWAMSCRVFKRHLEYAMFDALVAMCKKQGIRIIRGYYYETNKNKIVAEFYQELGFQCIKDEVGYSEWELAVAQAIQPRNTIIQIGEKHENI